MTSCFGYIEFEWFLGYLVGSGIFRVIDGEKKKRKE